MTPSPRDWRPFALLLVDAQAGFWPEAIARGFPDFPDRVAELLRVCRAEGITDLAIRQPDWLADLQRLDDLARPPSPPYPGRPTTTRAARSSSPRTV